MARKLGVLGLVVAAVFLSFAGGAKAATPAFGPNVVVIDPSMSQATIQSTLDAISTQQVPNQFGSTRYAILFKPGTYGSAASPLVFQVGYYTQVAGLGASPGDVVVNGAIDVFNQCDSGGVCNGTDNFWRSLSNLTLNVTLPSTPPNYAPYSGDPYTAGCDNSAEIWAVSQAAPMRRVVINGNVVLQDYCSPTGFVSGGFFADDTFNGAVDNYGQQQFFTRNSTIGSWSNGVWNQVFLGDTGAPATSWGAGSSQYTNVPATPVSAGEPFLTTDASGTWSVSVPGVQQNSVGPSTAAGTSIPLSRFFIASPSTSVLAIDAALALGKDLILTPGVYNLNAPIVALRPDTVVLGLGFPTLIPQHGLIAMQTASVPGIKISGIIFDAGPQSSPTLLDVGLPILSGGTRDASDPTLLQDVFFRIGGAEAGKATTALVVNADNAILDDVWIWRADHGAGVGWTSNTADTGLDRERRQRQGVRPVRRALPEVGGDLERAERRGRVLPERAAVRPAEPGGVDGEPDDRRLPGLPRGAQGDDVPGLRDGELFVLQPGCADLRHPVVPVSEHSGRAVPRRLHGLPRRDTRERRHPVRDQWCRRAVDRCERRRPGGRHELSVGDNRSRLGSDSERSLTPDRAG